LPQVVLVKEMTMEMKLVNLTPHPINLRAPYAGVDEVVEPSGTVARVSATPGALEVIEGLPVPLARPDVFGDVEGLPPPEEGVAYIVSAMVGAHVSRPDVFTPGTGPKDGAIRNDKGHVIAVTRLKSTV
jgi:hypothetical protein